MAKQRQRSKKAHEGGGGLTIGAALRTLFAEWPADFSPLHSFLPFPTDYFAAAAYLLELSGAYHHIDPYMGSADSTPPDPRRIIISPETRTQALREGYRWRRDARQSIEDSIPPRVRELWVRLTEAHRDAPVFQFLARDAPRPEWWDIALELLMIADEASEGIGFSPDNPFLEAILALRGESQAGKSISTREIRRGIQSFSTASPDVACVQPKSLTPSVGCSLRSLSHHLAFLPPQGMARARWVYQRHPAGPWTNFGRDLLNLLLVPFPFSVQPEAFEPAGLSKLDDWGWFHVNQIWLPQTDDGVAELVAWVRGLLANARGGEGRPIHGVVFPELALDQRCFLAIADALKDEPSLEFFISGVSADDEGRQGNFVATAPFFLLDDPAERDRPNNRWQDFLLIREKHHRWKLNKSQLKIYGLDESLKGASSWWEKLDIRSRTLDVHVFRGESTLTTLICEDLARVDPCQLLLRAIGPNLVIALLMDGPQLPGRWPGRYATVLADDPGSSVLTLTSFGLVNASNKRAGKGQNTSIGLWKHDGGVVIPLELPRHAEALLLTLRPERRSELTLDGRSDNEGAHSWIFDSCEGVRRSALSPEWIEAGRGPQSEP